MHPNAHLMMNCHFERDGISLLVDLLHSDLMS